MRRLTHALAIVTALFGRTPRTAWSATAPSPPPQARGRCAAVERTLWWCLAARRWFVLCASKDLDGQNGYLQYRAGRGDTREVIYPAERRHPAGLFTLSLAARGVSLSFDDAGIAYTISEPLAGRTSIDVTRADGRPSEVTCSRASATLTLTETLRLLETARVYR